MDSGNDPDVVHEFQILRDREEEFCGVIEVISVDADLVKWLSS